MDYMQNITPKDMEYIIAWFKEHEKDLPGNLQLNDTIKISDLRKYVTTLIEIYNLHRNLKAFNGQIFHLWMIKEILEKEWAMNQ